MISQEENRKRIAETVGELISGSNKSVFIIIDGDRTLIPVDSTKYFFRHLDLDYSVLKNIFMEHGYTFEAFNKAARYYSSIDNDAYASACYVTAQSVSIYPEFLSFIDQVKDHAELILVTAGLRQSWQNIISRHALEFMHVLGGNHFPPDSFIIDKESKGLIARILMQAGKKVFAFGDTMIDFEMLSHAQHAYLVVNEKLNQDLIPHAYQIPHLEQISFSEYWHPRLPQTDLNAIIQLIIQQHGA
jgi:phosphoserine phosphatase